VPDLSLERSIYQQGLRLIAGVDEAGRGPLAGPVVAAAVILDPDLSEDEPWLELVDDSKRLSPARREKALAWIQERALGVGVAQVGAEEIDRLGIGPANVEAMLRAVANLPVQPDHLLLDFVQLKKIPPHPPLKRGDGGICPFDLVIRGDSISYSIAAASIVAKVTRDRWMLEADARFPAYSFARNKGYPTPHHLARLREFGPCDIHRRSFAPVREVAALLGHG
jgi:ribonuclease HII